MPSVTDIANRALSRVGDNRILALTEDTPQARAVNEAWEMIRDEVLRAHPWGSCQARVQLAKEATGPDFEYDNQYPLPPDCVTVNELYGTDLPWVVEGRKVLTDAGPPLNARYTKRETDANKYDPLLSSALASRLAAEVVEELTQSNTKGDTQFKLYQQILRVAKRSDGQEQSDMPFAEDSWILSRV